MDEILSTIKIKKLKINNILVEKNKDLFENSDFEQNYDWRTATGIYIFGHDNLRFMTWLAENYESVYENMNYYDLMAGVLNCLKMIIR